MIGLTVFVGACVKEEAGKSDTQGGNTQGQSSGTETADAGLVDFIKKQKLANFQSTTIGNSFDSYSYVKKKEWKSASLKSGHIAVDFIGWFEPASLSEKDIKAGVTSRGLNVTFVVQPDGAFYVFAVTVVESTVDGKTHRVQSLDSAGALDNIYANKKINL